MPTKKLIVDAPKAGVVVERFGTQKTTTVDVEIPAKSRRQAFQESLKAAADSLDSRDPAVKQDLAKVTIVEIPAKSGRRNLKSSAYLRIIRDPAVQPRHFTSEQIERAVAAAAARR